MRPWIALIAGILLSVLIWGCSLADFSVRRRMAIGDRQLEWGLVYYRSWLRENEEKYLNLAREHTADAVLSFYDIQFDLGHSYPDFYIIDHRRREGCRFLREIDIVAARNRVSLDDQSREGCLK